MRSSFFPFPGRWFAVIAALGFTAGFACSGRDVPIDSDASVGTNGGAGGSGGSGITGGSGTNAGGTAGTDGHGGTAGGAAGIGGQGTGGTTGGAGGIGGQGTGGTTGGAAGNATGGVGGRGGGGAGAGGVAAAAGTGGVAGRAGAAGFAGGGCIWPTYSYPVSGAGFDAYEGIDAIAWVTPIQICPVGTTDKNRITSGRFNLAPTGYGTLRVFLDMNGDGTYQRSEPDWTSGGPTPGSSNAATPADFDAVTDLQLELSGIPPQYQSQTINVLLCDSEDAAETRADAAACSLQRYQGSLNPSDTFQLGWSLVPSQHSFVIWFNPNDVDPLPLDRSLLHFIGHLSKPPCSIEGDLTTCSLIFGDLVTGDGGTDAGQRSDASAVNGNTASLRR